VRCVGGELDASSVVTDRARWQDRHRARPERAVPSSFVAHHVAELALRSPGGCALDVACGSGRHAILLAEHGFRTVAFDHASSACRRLAHDDPRVRTVVADAGSLPFRATTFALIVQTRFLDRAILPHLIRLLVPGGVLLVETFLVAQHETTGHPRREFCLEPGELEMLCRDGGNAIEVLDRREGLQGAGADAAHLAAIAVCKV
jgi:tellurite methyltransferase